MRAIAFLPTLLLVGCPAPAADDAGCRPVEVSLATNRSSIGGALLNDDDVRCSDDDPCVLIADLCGAPCDTGGARPRIAVARSRVEGIDARRPAAVCPADDVDHGIQCEANAAICRFGTCHQAVAPAHCVNVVEGSYDFITVDERSGCSNDDPCINVAATCPVCPRGVNPPSAPVRLSAANAADARRDTTSALTPCGEPLVDTPRCHANASMCIEGTCQAVVVAVP